VGFFYNCQKIVPSEQSPKRREFAQSGHFGDIGLSWFACVTFGTIVGWPLQLQQANIRFQKSTEKMRCAPKPSSFNSPMYVNGSCPEIKHIGRPLKNFYVPTFLIVKVLHSPPF
jgi:hypothetical protein